MTYFKGRHGGSKSRTHSYRGCEKREGREGKKKGREEMRAGRGGKKEGEVNEGGKEGREVGRE